MNTDKKPNDWTIEEVKERAVLAEVENRMKAITNGIQTLTKEEPTWVEEWKEWDYDQERNIIKYPVGELKKNTPRWIMSEVLNTIGYMNYTFTEELNMSDLPTPYVEFTRLWETIEEIRVHETMIYNMPGTENYFEYRHKKMDSMISGWVEEKLPKSIQYLYSIWAKYWQLPLSTGIDEVVVDALKETEDSIYEAYTAPSMNASRPIIEEKIFPVYLKLLDQDEQEQQNNKSSGSSSSLKNKLQQALKWAETMGDIKEIMMKMSEGNTDPQNWEKANFKKDVDEEFDKKEQQSQQGNTDNSNDSTIDTDDDVLNSHWFTDVPPTLSRRKAESYEVLYWEIHPFLKYFVKKLWNVMKDNRYNRAWWAYRTGKLNTNKLYKLSAGSDKLFKRKIIRRHKDYLVTILVDESGSMCWKNARHAAKWAILLAETLNKVWIDFEIRWFNTLNRTYKRFKEKFNWSHRRQLERITIEPDGRWAGGNNDGYALKRAHYAIQRSGTRNTERIIFVLSDGYPAEDYRQIDDEDYRNFKFHRGKTTCRDYDLHTEIAAASKDTTVIWIWIEAPCVAEYYPKNIIVDDVSELPLRLLNQLKGNIKRG